MSKTELPKENKGGLRIFSNCLFPFYALSLQLTSKLILLCSPSTYISDWFANGTYYLIGLELCRSGSNSFTSINQIELKSLFHFEALQQAAIHCTHMAEVLPQPLPRLTYICIPNILLVLFLKGLNVTPLF